VTLVFASESPRIVTKQLGVVGGIGLVCGAAIWSCAMPPEPSSQVEARRSAIVDPTPPTQAPMAVYRWPNAAGDWVNIPGGGHQPSKGTMENSTNGYTRNDVPQFRALLLGTQDMVPVFRWKNNTTGDWRTVLQGLTTDNDMANLGYGLLHLLIFDRRWCG
jgi:hypothetical protein